MYLKEKAAYMIKYYFVDGTERVEYHICDGTKVNEELCSEEIILT